MLVIIQFRNQKLVILYPFQNTLGQVMYRERHTSHHTCIRIY